MRLRGNGPQNPLWYARSGRPPCPAGLEPTARNPTIVRPRPAQRSAQRGEGKGGVGVRGRTLARRRRPLS